MAYTLKHLTTLPEALGGAIHRRATECVQPVARGRELPSVATMVRATRKEISRIIRSADDAAAFLARPKDRPMLREVLLGGGLTEERIQPSRERMHRCLHALYEHPIFAELRTVDPNRIVINHKIASFQIDDVTVFLAVDLAYQASTGWCVVDWKSGAVDHAIDQIAVYGLYRREGLRFVRPQEDMRRRVIGLDDGDETDTLLTPADLDDAAQRIRESVARMRTLLSDVPANQPLVREDFRPTLRWSTCQGCKWLPVCKGGTAFEIEDPHESGAELAVAGCSGGDHHAA
jgi:hypothetical protein